MPPKNVLSNFFSLLDRTQRLSATGSQNATEPIQPTLLQSISTPGTVSYAAAAGDDAIEMDVTNAAGCVFVAPGGTPGSLQMVLPPSCPLTAPVPQDPMLEGLELGTQLPGNDLTNQLKHESHHSKGRVPS